MAGVIKQARAKRYKGGPKHFLASVVGIVIYRLQSLLVIARRTCQLCFVIGFCLEALVIQFALYWTSDKLLTWIMVVDKVR